MKLAPLLSPALALTLALWAGLMPVPAQETGTVPVMPQRPPVLPVLPPGSASAQQAPQPLAANYRIVISASAKGRSLGEIATQTCSPSFMISGSLSQPTEQQPDDADISLHGTLSELEDGRLKLGYSLSSNALVPSSQMGKPGTANAQTTYSSTRHKSVGVVIWYPGRTCELLSMSGVDYTLCITPDKWDKPKPKPAASPTKKDSAEAVETKPTATTEQRGPSPEVRQKYESLSEAGRERFRNRMRELIPQMKNMTQEEGRAQAAKLLDEALAQDKAGKK